MHIVIVNQYYIPDVAATGQLLHELAVELTERGFEVEVLSGQPSYGSSAQRRKRPRHEIVDSVRIRRLATTQLGKDHLLSRAVDYATFLIQLVLRLLLTRRKDAVYLYATNPPFLGVLGAITSLFRRHRYVLLVHDAYPQLAVWVGTIKQNGLVERLWHRMNRLSYHRATMVIVLCHAAKTLVCETYRLPSERVQVIPNWADGDMLRRKPKQESAFAAAHGLLDLFTVLYSGNLGLYYEFETILAAAERLRDAACKFVFVGAGGKKAWIEEQVMARGLDNTLVLPYQPYKRLPDSLAAADASLVTIAEGIEGISFPSKLYSALAIGRPVLALSESSSELRRIVEKHQVGLWVELGDSEGMAASVRRLIADPEEAAALGQRARDLFERDYTREIAGSRYAEVLRKAISPQVLATNHKPSARST